MSIVTKDEIAAYQLNHELVCTDCIKKEEEITSEDTIVRQTQIDDSDDLYFCDRCKKRIE